MNKFTALIIISFLISPLPVLAAGLQASPSSLDFSVSAGQGASKSLVISNPTADVQIFELSTDEYSELILPAGEKNLREVTAFPLTSDGRDPMMSSPSEVSKEQLEELGLEVKKK
jgi:hypothetical protein